MAGSPGCGQAQDRLFGRVAADDERRVGRDQSVLGDAHLEPEEACIALTRPEPSTGANSAGTSG